ncbi:hypothetical protein DXG03_002025 [Asterophora parasitica]|uniref:Uncharacterized protein n=1 Tax=Asterophora parasitica TaxID=117018 RepID=A0A9P7G3D3_9AGAR|nr:hypothetical protein DXG03_002025 [Asterophora parasitica]
MSHYIRTIHTDFTLNSGRAAAASSSRTWSAPSYAGTSAAAHANLVHNLGGIITNYDGGNSGNSAPYTRRRSVVSLRGPPRRTPPALPRVTPPASIKFDPFSDGYSVDPLPRRSLASAADPVLYRTPRITSHTPLRIQPPQEVAPAPPPPQQPPQPQFDRNARSRLVAGILLNRVHAVGKPMRRRSADGPREYVKSGLSSVVCVEA